MKLSALSCFAQRNLTRFHDPSSVSGSQNNIIIAVFFADNKNKENATVALAFCSS